jgi:hypothetical protein
LEAEKKERYKESKQNGLNLHIWERKEIENYLIVPSAICRIIEKEKRLATSITLEILNQALSEIIENLKTEIVENYATEIWSKDKGKALKTFMKEAREIFLAKFAEDNFMPIPGKTTISKLSEWASKTYKVNLSPAKIAREIQKYEIHKEVVKVITAIENKTDF